MEFARLPRCVAPRNDVWGFELVKHSNEQPIISETDTVRRARSICHFDQAKARGEISKNPILAVIASVAWQSHNYTKRESSNLR